MKQANQSEVVQIQRPCYQFAIKINTVKLNVKFPCSMVLKYESQPISPQVTKESSNTFNFSHQIILKDSLGLEKFQIGVFLITQKRQNSMMIVNSNMDRSQCTNTIFAGQIKLQQQKMILHQGRSFDIPLTNCLDSTSFCSLTVLKVRNLQNKKIRTNSLLKMSQNLQIRSSRFHSVQANSILKHLSPKQTSQIDQEVSNSVQKIRLRIDSRSKNQMLHSSVGPSNLKQSVAQYRSSREKLRRVDSLTNSKPPLSPTGGYYLSKYNSNTSAGVSHVNQVSNLRHRQIPHQILTYQPINSQLASQTMRSSSNQRKIQLALQRSQQKRQIQVSRLKSKIKQLQKTLQVKEKQIKQQKQRLMKFQQELVQNKYLQQQINAKNAQKQILQSTIKSLKDQNQLLKLQLEEIESKQLLVKRTLQLENEKLLSQLQTIKQDHFEEIKKKSAQNDQLQYELQMKRTHSSRMKRMIEDLQERLDEKTFQNERDLRLLKEDNKRKCDQMTHLIKSLENELKTERTKRQQFQKELERLKMLLSDKQKQFYASFQQVIINKYRHIFENQPQKQKLFKEQFKLKLKEQYQQHQNKKEKPLYPNQLQTKQYQKDQKERLNRQYKQDGQKLSLKRELLSLKQKYEYMRQKLQSANNRQLIYQNDFTPQRSRLKALKFIQKKQNSQQISQIQQLSQSIKSHQSSKYQKQKQKSQQSWKLLIKIKNDQIQLLQKQIEILKMNQTGKQSLHQKTIELKDFMIYQLQEKLHYLEERLRQQQKKLLGSQENQKNKQRQEDQAEIQNYLINVGEQSYLINIKKQGQIQIVKGKEKETNKDFMDNNFKVQIVKQTNSQYNNFLKRDEEIIGLKNQLMHLKQQNKTLINQFKNIKTYALCMMDTSPQQNNLNEKDQNFNQVQFWKISHESLEQQKVTIQNRLQLMQSTIKAMNLELNKNKQKLNKNKQELNLSENLVSQLKTENAKLKMELQHFKRQNQSLQQALNNYKMTNNSLFLQNDKKPQKNNNIVNSNQKQQSILSIDSQKHQQLQLKLTIEQNQAQLKHNLYDQQLKNQQYPTQSQAEQDFIIESYRLQNEELQRQNGRLQRQNGKLQRQNQQLHNQLQSLQNQYTLKIQSLQQQLQLSKKTNLNTKKNKNILSNIEQLDLMEESQQIQKQQQQQISKPQQQPIQTIQINLKNEEENKKQQGETNQFEKLASKYVSIHNDEQENKVMFQNGETYNNETANKIQSGQMIDKLTTLSNKEHPIPQISQKNREEQVKKKIQQNDHSQQTKIELNHQVQQLKQKIKRQLIKADDGITVDDVKGKKQKLQIQNENVIENSNLNEYGNQKIEEKSSNHSNISNPVDYHAYKSQQYKLCQLRSHDDESQNKQAENKITKHKERMISEQQWQSLPLPQPQKVQDAIDENRIGKRVEAQRVGMSISEVQQNKLMQEQINELCKYIERLQNQLQVKNEVILKFQTEQQKQQQKIISYQNQLMVKQSHIEQLEAQLIRKQQLQLLINTQQKQLRNKQYAIEQLRQTIQKMHQNIYLPIGGNSQQIKYQNKDIQLFNQYDDEPIRSHNQHNKQFEQQVNGHQNSYLNYIPKSLKNQKMFYNQFQNHKLSSDIAQEIQRLQVDEKVNHNQQDGQGKHTQHLDLEQQIVNIHSKNHNHVNNFYQQKSSQRNKHEIQTILLDDRDSFSNINKQQTKPIVKQQLKQKQPRQNNLQDVDLQSQKQQYLQKQRQEYNHHQQIQQNQQKQNQQELLKQQKTNHKIKNQERNQHQQQQRSLQSLQKLCQQQQIILTGSSQQQQEQKSLFKQKYKQQIQLKQLSAKVGLEQKGGEIKKQTNDQKKYLVNKKHQYQNQISVSSQEDQSLLSNQPDGILSSSQSNPITLSNQSNQITLSNQHIGLSNQDIGISAQNKQQTVPNTIKEKQLQKYSSQSGKQQKPSSSYQANNQKQLNHIKPQQSYQQQIINDTNFHSQPIKERSNELLNTIIKIKQQQHIYENQINSKNHQSFYQSINQETQLKQIQLNQIQVFQGNKQYGCEQIQEYGQKQIQNYGCEPNDKPTQINKQRQSQRNFQLNENLIVELNHGQQIIKQKQQPLYQSNQQSLNQPQQSKKINKNYLQINQEQQISIDDQPLYLQQIQNQNNNLSINTKPHHKSQSKQQSNYEIRGENEKVISNDKDKYNLQQKILQLEKVNELYRLENIQLKKQLQNISHLLKSTDQLNQNTNQKQITLKCKESQLNSSDRINSKNSSCQQQQIQDEIIVNRRECLEDSKRMMDSQLSGEKNMIDQHDGRNELADGERIIESEMDSRMLDSELTVFNSQDQYGRRNRTQMNEYRTQIKKRNYQQSNNGYNKLYKHNDIVNNDSLVVSDSELVVVSSCCNNSKSSPSKEFVKQQQQHHLKELQANYQFQQQQQEIQKEVNHQTKQRQQNGQQSQQQKLYKSTEQNCDQKPQYQQREPQIQGQKQQQQHSIQELRQTKQEGRTLRKQQKQKQKYQQKQKQKQKQKYQQKQEQSQKQKLSSKQIGQQQNQSNQIGQNKRINLLSQITLIIGKVPKDEDESKAKQNKNLQKDKPNRVIFNNQKQLSISQSEVKQSQNQISPNSNNTDRDVYIIDRNRHDVNRNQNVNISGNKGVNLNNQDVYQNYNEVQLKRYTPTSNNIDVKQLLKQYHQQQQLSKQQHQQQHYGQYQQLIQKQHHVQQKHYKGQVLNHYDRKVQNQQSLRLCQQQIMPTWGEILINKPALSKNKSKQQGKHGQKQKQKQGQMEGVNMQKQQNSSNKQADKQTTSLNYKQNQKQQQSGNNNPKNKLNDQTVQQLQQRIINYDLLKQEIVQLKNYIQQLQNQNKNLRKYIIEMNLNEINHNQFHSQQMNLNKGFDNKSIAIGINQNDSQQPQLLISQKGFICRQDQHRLSIKSDKPNNNNNQINQINIKSIQNNQIINNNQIMNNSQKKNLNINIEKVDLNINNNCGQSDYNDGKLSVLFLADMETKQQLKAMIFQLIKQKELMAEENIKLTLRLIKAQNNEQQQSILENLKLQYIHRQQVMDKMHKQLVEFNSMIDTEQSSYQDQQQQQKLKYRYRQQHQQQLIRSDKVIANKGSIHESQHIRTIVKDSQHIHIETIDKQKKQYQQLQEQQQQQQQQQLNQQLQMQPKQSLTSITSQDKKIKSIAQIITQNQQTQLQNKSKKHHQKQIDNQNQKQKQKQSITKNIPNTNNKIKDITASMRVVGSIGSVKRVKNNNNNNKVNFALNYDNAKKPNITTISLNSNKQSSQ